jgi:hypothetical protein
MSDLVASKISYLSWTIALMPICSDEYPTPLANFGKEGFVGRACVRGDVLLVDAIAGPASIKLVNHLGAIPVFVKVEGEVRQPSL